MRIVKENPALAVGIGLPLIVIIVFSLTIFAPKILILKPRYNLVFLLTSTFGVSAGQDEEFRYQVENHRLKIYHRALDKKTCCAPLPKLYMYNAITEHTEPIALPPTSLPANDTDWHEVVLPDDLVSLQFDSSQIAPDGYEFHTTKVNYTGGMWPFFDGHTETDAAGIYKHGHYVDLHIPQDNHVPDSSFVGWVIGRD
jgi:hypothetical protein